MLLAEVNPDRILGWVDGIPLQETGEGRIGLSASLVQESLLRAAGSSGKWWLLGLVSKHCRSTDS